MGDYHEFHDFLSLETELFFIKMLIIHALAETPQETYAWQHWQGSFCVCAQPMREGVTL